MDPKEIKALIQTIKANFETENQTLRDAVKQLEEQLSGIDDKFERRLEAVRRSIYDDRGRYRGLFGNEEEARGFGLYVMAHAGHDARALGALKSEFKDLFQRAMGDDATSIGTPVEYSARIQRLVEEYGVFPANAFRMPMSGDKLTFQRRTSGLKVFKTGYNTAATESQSKYATVHLNADAWNTLTLYPKDLGEDAAVEVGDMIAMDISQAFAEALDDAAFIGDGTPDYLDVLGITTRLKQINGVDDGGGIVLGTGASGAGWNSLAQDDFLKVKAATPRYASRNGKWYCSNAFFWRVLAKITLAAGGTTAGEIAGKRQLMFLGDPVEITESMPKAAGDSQICALYGDLRMSSTHGVRKELIVEESREARFIERQVAVLGTQRHAVDNHTLGDDTTAGPVVGLITPIAA